MAGEITTALTELKKRQAELATNLTAMGQHTDAAEPLDVQIPKVLNIETGGVTIAESDINFYDYDGTLVESWTLAQARVATSLPDGLTHDGLVFQGWNWSLEDINALTMPMDVGAMYGTASGKTEIDIMLTEATGLIITVAVYNVAIVGIVGGLITVDWGDGNIDAPTSTTIGSRSFAHTYSELGQYTISIDSTGTYYPYSSSSSKSMFGAATNHSCTAVRLGDRCTNLGQYAFYGCHSLKAIIIPSGVTTISQCAIYGNYNLVSLVIPSSVINIASNLVVNCYNLMNISIPISILNFGSTMFSGTYKLRRLTIPPSIVNIGASSIYVCYNLEELIIPSSVTAIDSNAFYYCIGLKKLIIPSSVVSIGAGAMQYCFGMLEYIMLGNEPPTLGSTTVFNGINSLCKIKVPPGSLETYQTATNWASFSKYMEEWEEAA